METKDSVQHTASIIRVALNLWAEDILCVSLKLKHTNLLLILVTTYEFSL
jgi:hypothetical protein